MNTQATSLNSLPLAQSANLALAQFMQATAFTHLPFTGASLLYERAFMQGLTPQGAVSPNGSCQLLLCRDAMLAVNLPRQSDWELLPAWLGPSQNIHTIAPGDWAPLKQGCLGFDARDLLPRAQLLGLAVTTADELPEPPFSPAHIRSFHHPPSLTLPPGRKKKPLVVDLSSLWAGPLCSHLLQQAGCRVIKVEGLNRLDGARTGSPAFYRLLNQGKDSVVLDFKREIDVDRLKQLIAHADIVIEASRPRALQNLGITAEEWVQTRPGLVWLSITGYGRYGEQGNRIGFGDDTAAASGLCKLMHEATGQYQFIGDAIADPLTGIHAALFAWQSYQAGGNDLISISLRDTVAHCIHQELNLDREIVLNSLRQWPQRGHQLNQIFPAGARVPIEDCADAGRDNDAVFEALDLAAGLFH